MGTSDVLLELILLYYRLQDGDQVSKHVAVGRCHELLVNVSNIRKYTVRVTHRGADKSLARPGRKQATATEDFDVHISYL